MSAQPNSDMEMKRICSEMDTECKQRLMEQCMEEMAQEDPEE